ncbi:long-chain-fatty-acid--CoA ligase [Phenylobacterium sp.]|uniref:long-chain-fatty-acid--CoA ligase n=1 Tax=Phenylobacterium sp. TaxID=1871053 RepID=UPI0027371A78|nr:long-chain-fatty-acid--CoA ligase [Phenylobacterium sp.]MDP3852624.1 long-chain-fatty-acid--CoA ligase [Phenylobacterium sp.]
MSQGITCVADVARHHALARPEAQALWFEGEAISYAQFDALSSQCAQALLGAGVQAGDRVGTLAKGNADFFVLWFGCLKIRACLTPVNWRLAPPEIAFILKDAGCKLLVVGRDYAETLAGLDLPDLSTVIQFEPGHPERQGFRAWIGAHPAIDPKLAALPDDDVIQLYTSGTTGLPKGVQLTETNYLASFEGATKVWAKFTPGDGVLVAMPLFHVAGANLGMLSLMQGARAVIMREVDIGLLLELIEEHRIKHAFMAPAIINMVLQHPAQGEADLSSLRHIYYGASPISEEVLTRAQARFGADFMQLYGLTETIGGGTYLPPEAHDPALGKLRACGKPTPGYEIRIRLDGRDAAVGEVGEIEIRSSGIMKGYWNRPEATAEAICPQGWFRSGDAGYFDVDGYLFIHDRVKDMIVSGGENIYPAEVENALMGHPAVADAAVIGVPDERWGEAVKAVVVLRPGAEADTASIIEHCRGQIAGFKTPKSVDYVAVLPRNPSGKVLRRELRDPYWQGRTRNVG